MVRFVCFATILHRFVHLKSVDEQPSRNRSVFVLLHCGWGNCAFKSHIFCTVFLFDFDLWVQMGIAKLEDIEGWK